MPCLRVLDATAAVVVLDRLHVEQRLAVRDAEMPAHLGVGDDRLHPAVPGVRPDADRLLQHARQRRVREVAVREPREQLRVQRLRQERAHERADLAVDAAQPLDADAAVRRAPARATRPARPAPPPISMPTRSFDTSSPAANRSSKKPERRSQQPLGQRRARDERALAAQPVQLAARDEPADRLADDRARDAELLAQLRLGRQHVARRQSSPDASCCSMISSSCA